MFVAIATTICVKTAAITSIYYVVAMENAILVISMSIAGRKDGRVVNVKSGIAIIAADVRIYAKNADRMKIRNNKITTYYIMAAFAESFTPPALPKVLTMVLNPDKPFDTYQIPAGTKLFKSYRKQLSQWTPDQVFPVNGPAYFGFDEPNVSANYGFAFAYKSTPP